MEYRDGERRGEGGVRGVILTLGMSELCIQQFKFAST